MILPQKVYDVLKFIVKFVPLLVAFLGTVLKVLNVGEDKINIILVILGAVGTLVQGLLEICRANHYKVAAEDGEEIPVDEYDPIQEDKTGWTQREDAKIILDHKTDTE